MDKIALQTAGCGLLKGPSLNNIVPIKTKVIAAAANPLKQMID